MVTPACREGSVELGCLLLQSLRAVGERFGAVKSPIGLGWPGSPQGFRHLSCRGTQIGMQRLQRCSARHCQVGVRAPAKGGNVNHFI